MKGKKKLMLLGGLRSLIPVIKLAHNMNLHVITVDYLPGNDAHKFSDEYYNVSIIDKEAVLELAKKLNIDGIMSFAVDPGVVTASYVAEKMGLPFQGSFESVSILQDKALFRKFLTDNGFNVPKAKGYEKIEDALSENHIWPYPVIVKPVDSAGSKGVSKVDSPDKLKDAIIIALKASYSKRFIIEEYIETKGLSSDSESFSINGDLAICTFSDQRFDTKAENPFVPAAYSWPSTMEISYQKELHKELQRLVNLLDLKTGIYNIETRIGVNGKSYIMEFSPRGGGPRLAEMSDLAFNCHLVINAIRAAVNEPLIQDKIQHPDYFIVEMVIHADKGGIFQELIVSDYIKPLIIDIDLSVSKGNSVNSFMGANDSIGTLVLKCPNLETVKLITENISDYVKVNVE